MEGNEFSVFIDFILFGVKRRRPSVSPLHILHFSVRVQCFKVNGSCQADICGANIYTVRNHPIKSAKCSLLV